MMVVQRNDDNICQLHAVTEKHDLRFFRCLTIAMTIYAILFTLLNASSLGLMIEEDSLA